MKKILMIAAAAVCLASCSKNERRSGRPDACGQLDDRQSFAPTPVAMTASTRATDTDFELGDKGRPRGHDDRRRGKDFVSNKLMTFDGTDFKTEGFLLVRRHQCDSTLFAYYPLAGRRGCSRRNFRSGRTRAATTTRL